MSIHWLQESMRHKSACFASLRIVTTSTTWKTKWPTLPWSSTAEASSITVESYRTFMAFPPSRIGFRNGGFSDCWFLCKMLISLNDIDIYQNAIAAIICHSSHSHHSWSSSHGRLLLHQLTQLAVFRQERLGAPLRVARQFLDVQR